ncbi:DUF4367 domain-containing protein [Micromonospora sp. NIE79]|uniref:DUF4367 domain-containing protein n=1 Tax=Micromonospora trifolii TaxID=2911208 RepID=A0ABS9N6G6_9ACTN|nr:DUF4367 domain-containing protein [Micromonospora trifolii]MCG5445549.1 DUF4367 domain-containing protein [Micromonospora trifolii]
MIDREEIRAAFSTIADDAPSPERIRTNLVSLARRHRQRRVILRVAGVGVAATTVGVVGASAWRLSQNAESEFPALSGGLGGGWLEVPLRYRPTWLPHGYGQTGRTVVVVGDEAPVVSLDWQQAISAQDGNSPIISLMIGSHESLDADRPEGRTETVDVNGIPAQLVQSDRFGNGTYVIWQSPGQPQLIVTVLNKDELDEQRALALRVARSVRPDQQRTYVGPRFGWLPTDLNATPWRLSQGYEGQHWIQDVSATGTGGRQLQILMGPDVHTKLANWDAGAQPVQLNGSDARYVPEKGQLFLTLADGIQVFIGLDEASGQNSQPGGDPSPIKGPAKVPPELARIMESFEYGPWPDMTWIGKR